MITVINRASRFFYNRALGLLLIRVAIGALFLTHGWMKVMSIPMVMVMFTHFGFAPWVAYFIAWLEVIGGLALILGVATRVFAILFGIEMLVATLLIGFGRGLGVEFILALVSFGLALTGSGAYSIFKMECDNCGGMVCDGNVCVVAE